MAEIDKTLPNVKQTINIPAPEEIEIEDPMEDDDLEGDYDTEMDAIPSDEAEMDISLSF